MIMLYVKSFLILSVFLGILFLVWRAYSHFRSLPCPSWLGWLVELDNPLAKASNAAVIVKSLELQEGMSVLDFGCGPGRVTIPLARQVGSLGKVVAFDIQQKMLEKVRKKAEQNNLFNIEYLCGDGENIKLNEQFDRVALVAVLGEIPNKVGVLRSIRAALKDNGLVVITETIFDPHFQTQKVVENIALQANLQVKKIIGSWYTYTMVLHKGR
jgi:ubiquinone/menaquinone biosynthesis C-methylase UbiE